MSTEEQTSSASTIASTMQQMSISFGIATASLATAFFIPDRFHTSAPEMIHGIHKAFLVLGGLTVLSSLVFRELKDDDGDTVSQRKPCSTSDDDCRAAGKHGKNRAHGTHRPGGCGGFQTSLVSISGETA